MALRAAGPTRYPAVSRSPRAAAVSAATDPATDGDSSRAQARASAVGTVRAIVGSIRQMKPIRRVIGRARPNIGLARRRATELGQHDAYDGR